MGCWRATCGLSNLPINENDKVVAFLLKEKSLGDLRGGQFSNINDLFTPISAPIIGKYDGYGCVKDIEEKYKDLILEQVRSFFKEEALDDRLSIKKECSSINIETASLEDIIYEFERGNVVQNASNEIIELYNQSGEFHRGYYFTGLILFHKDAFDKLVSLKSSSDLYKENYNLAENLEKININKETENDVIDVLMNQIIFKSRLPRSEIKYFDIYVYWYKKAKETKMNKELLDFLRDGLLISTIMSSLNKPWMPQVISSQFEDDYDVFECLNDFITSKINDNTDDIEEDDNEDDKKYPDYDLEMINSIAKRFNIDLG